MCVLFSEILVIFLRLYSILYLCIRLRSYTYSLDLHTSYQRCQPMAIVICSQEAPAPVSTAAIL